MAINYETLLPDIIPMVPGCSDTLIENAIRSAIIELCEKSEVYQQDLDPISTSADIFEYDLDAPSNTTVHKIVWVTLKGLDLEPISPQLLEQRIPKWRTTATDTPQFYVKQSSSTMWLVPKPSTGEADAVRVRVVLKPTHTSRSCDNEVINDYRDTIINGAIFRLLRLPNKDWTDYSAASVYGSLFQEGVAEADKRARSADTGIARQVRYGGLHQSKRLRRRNYGTYKTRNW